MGYCTKCGREIPEGRTECTSCDKAPPALANITGDDYATFVGSNSGKYLAKFNKFGIEGNEHFTLTWHWPAFFVTSLWMVYRRMYGWAILAFITQFIPLVQLFALIFWPIMAHYIYFKHAKKNLIRIKQLPLTQETQKIEIAARGGVGPVAVLLGIIIVLILFGTLSVIVLQAHFDFLKKTKLQSVLRSMASVKTVLVAANTAEGRYIDCTNASDVRSKLGVTVDNRNIAAINITSGVITVTVHKIGGLIKSDVDGKTITLFPDETGSSWKWGGTVPARYWLAAANRVLKNEEARVWLDRATTLTEKKDWRGLRDVGLQWTKNEPDNPTAWHSLGYASAELDRHNDAINAFRQALKIHPRDAYALSSLGNAYYNLGRHNDAVEAFKEALRIDPKYTDAWYGLGAAYAGSGNRPAASGAVRELKNLDPKKADALLKFIGPPPR